MNNSNSDTAETELFLSISPFAIRVLVDGPRGDTGKRARRQLAILVFQQLRPLFHVIRYESLHHRDGTFDPRKKAISLRDACKPQTPQGQMGLHIRMARLKAGYSLQELGLRLGMNYKHLSEIERGCCRPRRRTRTLLEKTLGISLN